MASVDIYFDQIKSLLKAKGLTYRDVGEHLGLSEPSVKRLFSHKNIDFDRLLKLCELIDIRLEDLLRLASGEERPSSLNLRQEELLAEDEKLFIVFLLLQRRWSVKEILSQYRFSKTELTRLLITLEKNNLIELHPNDRVKVKFDDSLQWSPNGPIVKMYEQQVKGEFFSYDFNLKTDRLNLILREVGQSTYEAVLRRIDKFISDINLITKADYGLKKSDTRSIALMVGARPWILSLMDSYKRK